MSSGRSAGLEWFLLLMAPPSRRQQMSAKFSGLKVDKANRCNSGPFRAERLAGRGLAVDKTQRLAWLRKCQGTLRGSSALVLHVVELVVGREKQDYVSD
jgi:hypothetical protein